MKTTIELSDELFRKAKVKAALRGCRSRDLVEQGLRFVLETPHSAGGPRPALCDLMKVACGVVDSGMSDLGSNPKPIKRFGRAPHRAC